MANKKHSFLWNEIFKLRGITPKERKLALDFISGLEKHELLFKKHLKNKTEFKCQYEIMKKGWSDDFSDGYPYKSVFKKGCSAKSIINDTFPWTSGKNIQYLPGLTVTQAARFWRHIYSLFESIERVKKEYEKSQTKKLVKLKEAKW